MTHRAWLLLLLLLAGCERFTTSMAQQPRANPDSGSPVFADGLADRAPVPGAVVAAAGDRAAVSGGRHGAGVAPPSAPSPADLRAHGQARYAIYCTPCHGSTGAGDGPVVRRGFPAPPVLSADTLRRYGDMEIAGIIAHGRGRMGPFADRVGAADRYAIVAWLRELPSARGGKEAPQ